MGSPIVRMALDEGVVRYQQQQLLSRTARLRTEHGRRVAALQTENEQLREQVAVLECRLSAWRQAARFWRRSPGPLCTYLIGRQRRRERARREGFAFLEAREVVR